MRKHTWLVKVLLEIATDMSYPAQSRMEEDRTSHPPIEVEAKKNKNEPTVLHLVTPLSRLLLATALLSEADLQ